MPHLAIEYSPGLEHRADLSAICRAAHRAILDTNLFPVAGIRIRAHKADIAIVADGLDENDFLAMTLRVGAKRTTEQLKSAGNQIFAAVQAMLAVPLSTPNFTLSLEIRVIDPDLSWNDTPIHSRLSGVRRGIDDSSG